VIGSNGSLTGYGGGMRNKEYLLALEGSGTQKMRKAKFEVGKSLFLM
jgi:hypothetical protein